MDRTAAADASAELAAVLARLGALTDAAAADPTSADRAADAARIDQIALLERIQAAAAATQAALMVGFARSQVLAQQQAVLADPQGYVTRGRTARNRRRVGPATSRTPSPPPPPPVTPTPAGPARRP